MSEVVAGRQRYAPLNWDGEHAHPCLFCDQTVVDGAMWHSDVEVWICKRCIGDGKLGTLAADARVDRDVWITATVAEYDRCTELVVVRQANDEFEEAAPTDATARREWYHRYLASPAWKARRLIALDKAGYHCQVCNGTDCLDVHHRTYDRIGEEHHSDLTVLCRECHTAFHKAGRLAA